MSLEPATHTRHTRHTTGAKAGSVGSRYPGFESAAPAPRRRKSGSGSNKEVKRLKLSYLVANVARVVQSRSFGCAKTSGRRGNAFGILGDPMSVCVDHPGKYKY